jgi:hypothetical protein
MRRLLLPLGVVVMLLSVSCSRVSVAAPEGFAELEGGRSYRGAYRAVSPEGMLYRVRSIKNEPQKDLAFWGEALENHLSKEGYRANGKARSFESSGYEGLYYEWILPSGNESYLYLTALIVTDKTITLAEAAAPHPVFTQYRQALLDSLAGIRPRR